MEKEILEIFAVAKKAGDAAAADGGSSEVARCLDALKQLRKLPLTTKELVATKVGKGILCLTKHPQKKIQSAASDLRQHWKDLVIEETSAKNKTNHHPATASTSPAAAATTISSNKPAVATSPAAAAMVVNSSKPATARADPTPNGRESTKPTRDTAQRDIRNRSTKENPPPLSPPPPKLSAMIKCNDEARDKVREMVAEALVRVPSEVPAELKSEATAADPIRVAVAVECHMFEKLGKSTGAQKARYRSILFNMRDAKNPDLRRRVLLGQVSPVALVGMAAEDMASDERKRQNQQIKDKAIFECERGAPAKATTDQFKCGRCGKRKTTYYQLQTRSADEPMTTFVTCVECNNHWKFC